MRLDPLKSSLYYLAEHGGVNRAARFLSRNRLLVLCYHGVVSDRTPHDPRANIAVTASQFALQLRELRRHFRPVAMADVILAYYQGTPLPRSAVLLTFDDGFRNNIRYAAPLLREYGFPAVFFLATGHVGQDRMLWTQEIVERLVAWPEKRLPMPGGESRHAPDCPRGRLAIASHFVQVCKRLSTEERLTYQDSLRQHDVDVQEDWKRDLYEFMSWKEVRALVEQGFDIGAHTVDHPILTSLADGEVEWQLAESKRAIESHLNRECTCLAYPNGGKSDFSAKVIDIAQRLGFRLGFTLCEDEHPTYAKPFAIGRLCIARDTTIGLFRARVAGWR
jgi:peptidoglycan/xylan/chitin deacetylase (PgdA/CDA1 family)